METGNSKQNTEHKLNGHQEVLVRVLARETPDFSIQDSSDVTLTLLLAAVKEGIKEGIADEECLLDYSELAKRLGLGIRATKDLVNCGKITPALRYSNVARFHWPSVLQELKKKPCR
jgi:hypothetical protein